MNEIEKLLYGWKGSKKKPMDLLGNSKKQINFGFNSMGIFRDSDRDGVIDVLDCRPHNPKRQHNNQNLNGLYIRKIGEGNYAVMHRDSSYPLGYGRKTRKQAIKDIPLLLKFWRVKSASDPKLVEELEEMKKKSTKMAKQQEKHGNRHYRGYKRRDDKLVLEVGAGISPDTRATHAIDLQKPQIKFKNLNYKHGYDLNKKALPYGNSSFHRVISYGSLGLNFGTQKTYKEIYRVLKAGGILEIGIPKTYAKDVSFIVSNIRKAGFNYLGKKVIKIPDGGIMIRILARR